MSWVVSFPKYVNDWCNGWVRFVSLNNVFTLYALCRLCDNTDNNIGFEVDMDPTSTSYSELYMVNKITSLKHNACHTGP